MSQDQNNTPFNLEEAIDKIVAMKSLVDAQDEISEVIKVMAPQIKPEIEAMLTDAGKADIKAAAVKLHGQLTGLTGLVQQLAPQLALVQMFVSPEMIKDLTKQAKKDGLKKANTSSVDAVEAEIETIKLQKSFADGLSEAEHIKASQEINKLAPPRLKAFFNTVSAKENKSIPQLTREMRSMIQNNTEAELLASGYFKTPEAAQTLVLDGIVTAIANLDADDLVNAVNKIPQRIKAEDLSDLAIEFLSASKDVIEAAENGQNLDILANAHSKKVMKTLKSVFAAIEDTCVDAGLTLGNADEIAQTISDHRKAAKAQLKI